MGWFKRRDSGQARGGARESTAPASDAAPPLDAVLSGLIREFGAVGVENVEVLARRAAAAGLEADHIKTAGETRYVVFRGADPEMAKQFLLEQLVVNEGLLYFVVETADGNWGRDIEGLYLENLRPWQRGTAASCSAAIARIPGALRPSSGLRTAASGTTDNFIAELVCGSCGNRWWDGVRYQDITTVRCPTCRTANSVDTNSVRFDTSPSRAPSPLPVLPTTPTPLTEHQLSEPTLIALRLIELLRSGLAEYGRLSGTQRTVAAGAADLDALLCGDRPVEEQLRPWVEIRAIGHQLYRRGRVELMRSVEADLTRTDVPVFTSDQRPLTLWHVEGQDLVSRHLHSSSAAEAVHFIDTVWDGIGNREAYSVRRVDLGGESYEIRGTFGSPASEVYRHLDAYEAGGSIGDLDKAIAIGERAAADPSVVPALFRAVGTAYRTRYGRTRISADLDRAIELHGRALTAVSADDPDRSEYQVCLGTCHLDRFTDTGVVTHGDRAIELFTQSLTVATADHRSLPVILLNLALVYSQRFQHGGRSVDLDQAIEFGERAVETVLPEDSNRWRYLSVLGSLRHSRWTERRTSADLDSAIDLLRVATAMRRYHPERWGMLSDLGAAYLDRYQRNGAKGDSTSAIAYFENALTEIPGGDPDVSKVLSNLSLAYYLGSNKGEVSHDLEKAIEYGEQAKALGPEEHTNMPLWLSNLSLTYSSRYEHQGMARDLDSAISLLEQAVAITPDDRPLRPAYLCNLGAALSRRHQRDGRAADALAAVNACRRAARSPTAGTRVRIEAARNWGHAATDLGDADSALEGFRLAVDLLPRLAVRALDRPDSEHILGMWPGLASTAAAGAIEAGRPELALELLEHGRAVLWAQSLETRTDLTTLRETHPVQADELADLLAALDSGNEDIPAMKVSDTGSAVTYVAERRRDETWAAEQRLAELLAEIREQPGFGSFLSPPSADELCTAAIGGHVVVVNIAPQRCDALVIDPSGVDVVELPELTLQEVSKRAGAYFRALDERGTSTVHRSTRDDADSEVARTLRWLWQTIACRVLDHLGYTEPLTTQGDRPRVWWCPTWFLGSLPLHAAGPDDTGTRGVLDYVVSSYTPTVRALANARRAAGACAEPAADARLLLVAMPSTPGASDLPNVPREVAALAEHLGSARIELVQGSEATGDTVLDLLATHPWAHLSCHGIQNFTAPSSGGPVLYDGVLPISRVSRRRYTDGEFVCLSACRTHSVGIGLADEVITLAAALHYAGWRHVIATLWSVYDEDAATVTERIYRTIIDHGRPRTSLSARALHDAVLHLRAAYPGDPVRWIPFIHLGP